MLGVRSVSGLCLYDWETLELVRRIEIQAKSLHWSDSGHLLAIVTDDSYYILKYDSSALTSAQERTPDGVEAAFSVSYVNFSINFGILKSYDLFKSY